MTDANDILSMSVVEAAARQAARKVIQRAIQSGASVVIWDRGRIKKISAEELALKLAELDDVEQRGGGVR